MDDCNIHSVHDFGSRRWRMFMIFLSETLLLLFRSFLTWEEGVSAVSRRGRGRLFDVSVGFMSTNRASRRKVCLQPRPPPSGRSGRNAGLKWRGRLEWPRAGGQGRAGRTYLLGNTGPEGQKTAGRGRQAVCHKSRDMTAPNSNFFNCFFSPPTSFFSFLTAIFFRQLLFSPSSFVSNSFSSPPRTKKTSIRWNKRKIYFRERPPTKKKGKKSIFDLSRGALNHLSSTILICGMQRLEIIRWIFANRMGTTPTFVRAHLHMATKMPLPKPHRNFIDVSSKLHRKIRAWPRKNRWSFDETSMKLRWRHFRCYV